MFPNERPCGRFVVDNHDAEGLTREHSR
jgi:hypothetical protein